VIRNEFRQHFERAKSHNAIQRTEEAPIVSAAAFTPVKREYYKGDKSPTYREIDPEKTKEIAFDTHCNYKHT
jgi:hypothetical protein